MVQHAEDVAHRVGGADNVRERAAGLRGRGSHLLLKRAGATFQVRQQAAGHATHLVEKK